MERSKNKGVRACVGHAGGGGDKNSPINLDMCVYCVYNSFRESKTTTRVEGSWGGGGGIRG